MAKASKYVSYAVNDQDEPGGLATDPLAWHELVMEIPGVLLLNDARSARHFVSASSPWQNVATSISFTAIYGLGILMSASTQ